MLNTNDQRTVSRYCDLMDTEIESIAELARHADLGLPAPTCPGWTLGDVVRQTGEMFRWIEPIVHGQANRQTGFHHLDISGPDSPAERIDWLVSTGRTLLTSLRAADPDRPMWTWGSEQTARFWARRAYFNTAIHRADLELALGELPSFPAGVAVDGVQEFLQILAYAAEVSPRIAMLRGKGEILRLLGPEVCWRIELNPRGYEWRQTGGAGPADTTITARRPDDLLLFVWGRVGEPRITITGDRRLARTWTELSAFN